MTFVFKKRRKKHFFFKLCGEKNYVKDAYTYVFKENMSNLVSPHNSHDLFTLNLLFITTTESIICI